MTVDQLADYVKQYWPTLKARLLAGEYHPQGVRPAAMWRRVTAGAWNSRQSIWGQDMSGSETGLPSAWWIVGQRKLFLLINRLEEFAAAMTDWALWTSSRNARSFAVWSSASKFTRTKFWLCSGLGVRRPSIRRD